MATPGDVCQQLVAALASIAQPKTPSVEDRLKTLTTYTTAVAALGGMFYLFGFLIVNARLASFGIRSFALADPAYLAAGVSFFAVVGAPIILLIVAAGVLNLPRADATRMTFLLFTVYFWLLVRFFCNPSIEGVAAAADGSSLFPAAGATGVWVLSLLLAGTALFYVLPRPVENPPANRAAADDWLAKLQAELKAERRLKAALVIPALLVLLMMISLWARSLYPVGSPVVGGGRMPTVQIELASDVSPLLSELLHVPAGTRVLPPMPVLQDTGGMLTVILPGQRALALDRSMVLSIQYAR